MSCDRCIDIHQAQRLGLSRLPCACDCHINNSTGTIEWNNCSCDHTVPYEIVRNKF